jgi:hypothetical protein
MSRADEIAQGLRHEGGSLTFCLDAIEYGQGLEDYNAGKPPPRMTSDSYDLGRALGQRREDDARRSRELLAQIEADQAASRRRVREIIAEAGRPDVLAEYDARMADLDAARIMRTLPGANGEQ